MEIWWTYYTVCFYCYAYINTKLYHGPSTIIHFNFTTGPSSFDHITVTDCQYVVKRGFLKEKCLVGTKWYFKCPFSDNYYRVLVSQCRLQRFTEVCENDPAFYQSCGHMGCPAPLQTMEHGIGVCGEIVCDIRYGLALNDRISRLRNIANIVTNGNFGKYRCDGIDNCDNKISGMSVDERQCEDESSKFNCIPFSTWYSITVAFGQVCDNICDCDNCFEEANCFNRSVGIICHTRTSQERLQYLKPEFICDGRRQCFYGKDEEDCNSGEVCRFASFYLKNPLRALNSRNKCTIPDPTLRARLVCEDYRDQMNCSLISPLVCDVNGYETTLTEHVICKNHNLCDDQLDDICINIDSSCLIHKHRICDRVSDCPRNSDESDYFCLNLVSANMSCIRRMSYDKSAYPFPKSWVLDGVKDCLNGVDEDTKQWFRKCGAGNQDIFIFGESTACDEITLLKCPDVDYRLSLENLCKRFSNCDSFLCKTSRHSYRNKHSVQKAYNSIPTLFFCLPGLETMQIIMGNCENIVMKPKHSTLGISHIINILSNREYAASINCQDIFGELYLSLVCTDQCTKYIKCPLASLNHSSCINYSANERILTITDLGSLTVVLKTKDETMRQNVFGCANEKCIEYRQVCDLVDDCGDASDEINCANNFKCASGEYVPISMKCNGNFDCLDYSDECNAECDNQVRIFSNLSYKVISWTTGIISTVLNSIVIIKVLVEFKNLKTGTARMNNLLMIIVSLGDLLQGGFLFMVAISDEFINKSNCITQFKWTTSKMCNILGVLSTIGSQISLFSMTILSFIRAKGTRSMIRPSEKMPMKAKVFMTAEIFLIFFIATVLATFPIVLIPSIDDYFVRSLAYENNLFVGNLDKSQHKEIIRAYYGRLLSPNPSWKLIKRLVQDMFINGEVVGERIGFYGSNGFCVFNYFVRSDNQQKWFTGSVLFLNFTCVSIIVICYTIVNMSTHQSSAVAGNFNKQVMLRNRKIQRNIAVLITTDIVTWVPFMFISIIHFFEVVDASSWYSVFSIVVLPSNSIINPLLILQDTFIAFGKKNLKVVRKFRLLKMFPTQDAELSISSADKIPDPILNQT